MNPLTTMSTRSFGSELLALVLTHICCQTSAPGRNSLCLLTTRRLQWHHASQQHTAIRIGVTRQSGYYKRKTHITRLYATALCNTPVILIVSTRFWVANNIKHKKIFDSVDAKSLRLACGARPWQQDDSFGIVATLNETHQFSSVSICITINCPAAIFVKATVDSIFLHFTAHVASATILMWLRLGAAAFLHFWQSATLASDASFNILYTMEKAIDNISHLTSFATNALNY